MSKLTKSVVKSDATSSHDSPLKIQFLLGLRDLTNDNDLIWTCVCTSLFVNKTTTNCIEAGVRDNKTTMMVVDGNRVTPPTRMNI